MTPILALAFAALIPQVAAVPPAVPKVDAARADAALALSRTLNSEANIIGGDADDEKELALVGQLVEGNADLAALEKQSPGFMLDFARRLLPIVNRSMRERLPELQRRQAALYAARFDGGELRTLDTFYGSPTGRKMIAAAKGALKPEATLSEMKASPEFKVTADATIKDIRATVPAVVKSLGPEDEAALAALASSGLLGRLQALAPDTHALTIAWMDESAPWEEAATTELFKTVMTERGIEIE